MVQHRLAIGLYALHIKKWLLFYPLESFLFLRAEDVFADPVAAVSQITEFLGVAAVPREVAVDIFGEPENASRKEARQVLPLEPRTRELLEQFYRPYNKELATLLNDDSFLWTQ